MSDAGRASSGWCEARLFFFEVPPRPFFPEAVDVFDSPWIIILSGREKRVNVPVHVGLLVRIFVCVCVFVCRERRFLVGLRRDHSARRGVKHASKHNSGTAASWGKVTPMFFFESRFQLPSVETKEKCRTSCCWPQTSENIVFPCHILWRSSCFPFHRSWRYSCCCLCHRSVFGPCHRS